MRQGQESKKSAIGGLVLIAIGSIFLIGNYIPDLNMGRLWPVILIAVGVGILFDWFKSKG